MCGLCPQVEIKDINFQIGNIGRVLMKRVDHLGMKIVDREPQNRGGAITTKIITLNLVLNHQKSHFGKIIKIIMNPKST